MLCLYYHLFFRVAVKNIPSRASLVAQLVKNVPSIRGFPGGTLVVKNPPASAGDVRDSV